VANTADLSYVYFEKYIIFYDRVDHNSGGASKQIVSEKEGWRDERRIFLLRAAL
jgi:hypothetical protein